MPVWRQGFATIPAKFIHMAMSSGFKNMKKKLYDSKKKGEHKGKKGAADYSSPILFYNTAVSVLGGDQIGAKIRTNLYSVCPA